MISEVDVKWLKSKSCLTQQSVLSARMCLWFSMFGLYIRFSFLSSYLPLVDSSFLLKKNLLYTVTKEGTLLSTSMGSVRCIPVTRSRIFSIIITVSNVTWSYRVILIFWSHSLLFLMINVECRCQVLLNIYLETMIIWIESLKEQH